MMTRGGSINAIDARSMRLYRTKLSGNHEEGDTRLILHACEAADRGYERVLVICRDTDVLLLLVHSMSVVEVTQYMRYDSDLHSLWGTTNSASMD